MTEHLPDEDTIFELLQALHKGISPKFERCAGITPTRFRLLQELFRVSEISQISLQKTLDIDAAAVTRHLRGLEDSGMIARRNNPADNRVTLVSLTDHGREHINSYREEKTRFISELLTGFNEQERTVLAEMLTRLQYNINLL
ncbi:MULTISPECIES: MarR family winged helix-turn-helix transcriptional regulator [Paenibacillus]|uniref:MarR family winged helix-turn-helix transcriptional regulator n=1 Tax=Paenibacillus TaxID=44249 RepID=UPI0004F8B604|nr:MULTISPECIES: MarR family transcriptional regulator [unclassified Paenibacillus]AIQ27322.1 MarR family transcriptional regulator [Paenibacillus sp. FSL P4-0081]AIQ39116.1 MarR family transcriptional regulator [Paenibacillus sp. FSL R5-0912]OMF24647.1 transcriptional regulator [Paenibacillus sp. FSL H8-0259]